MASYHYRKIWETTNGTIPKDEFGRSYEIHHKDGNRENNELENLICVTIQEHYDIHYKQGDYGACVMIAKRMDMPPEYLSEIPRGKKRPGIGGVKKGTPAWNKGKSGYKLVTTESGKQRKRLAQQRHAKITNEMADDIRKLFQSCPEILDNRIGLIQRNGLKFTYENAFCNAIALKYRVTKQYIYRILRNK